MGFGDKLKEARTKRGLTQSQVADKVGINHTTLSKYENNKSEPDNETLKKLVDLYNVKVDWLYGREKKNMNEEDIKIIEGFRKLSERDQSYILDLMERLESSEPTKKE